MKAVLKIFAVLFVLGVSLLPATAAELLMLEEDGCPWCERWHEDIGVFYHKTSEGKRAPLRRIDIHGKLPDDLAGLKKGRYTPTFVLMDEGKEVGRIRGYPGEDFFWSLLAEMMKKLPAETSPVGG